VIKMEEDVGEGRGEEAGTGRALRRRLDEGGAAVQDERRLLRAHAEAQALAIQGMEQTRVIGEQLVQAKSRIAELTAEMKIKDAVMQEKERLFRELIQSKDVALQEKESHFGELINSKDVALQCKDELLQSKDAEIRLLHADLARSSAEEAAGGAAPHPAPSRAAAAADAAATAESLFQEGCLRKVKVLLRTMRRLCDFTALQRHRGMHQLSSTWASCLPTVKVLRRTKRRRCDSTALQRHRGMQRQLQR